MRRFKVGLEGISEITAKGSTPGPTLLNISLACGSLVKVVSQLPWGAALSVYHYYYLELFSIVYDLAFVPNSAAFLCCFGECEELSIISIAHNSFLCSEGTCPVSLGSPS